MIDEENSYALWEPTSYALGDIVRIKLGGECPHTILGTNLVQGREVISRGGHEKLFHNQLGMVVQINDFKHGHNYRVALLQPVVLSDDDIQVGADFASIELEPVERTIHDNERRRIRNFCMMIQVDYPSTEKS